MSTVATLDTATPAPDLAAPLPAGELFNAADWLLTRHARATPERTAITAIDLDGTVRSLTYGELDQDVRAAAAALLAQAGLRRDDAGVLVLKP